MECSPNPIPDTLRAQECGEDGDCQKCEKCEISKPFGEKCAAEFPADHVIKTCQEPGESGINENGNEPSDDRSIHLLYIYALVWLNP